MVRRLISILVVGHKPEMIQSARGFVSVRNDCHRVLTVVLSGACLVLATAGSGVASAQSTTAKPATSTSKTQPAATKKTTTTSSARTSAARAQAAARARAAAAARQQQDAMTAHFKRDLLGNLVPDVRAAAAIIYNPATGEVIWEENSHEERSIASLTKLMTAVTFIADDPDLTQRVAVTRADLYGASTTYLRAGELVSYDDLLHLALIASDNAAARVLARTSEGGTAAFVSRM